jgi:hypothetical protein|tara:strand:- start:125 stop:391 length:267 start_codon:yes stop_codon:yes gene_type:complete
MVFRFLVITQKEKEITMVETIVLFINGKAQKIEATISEETRPINGDEYHLVIHNKTGHQSLCTKENIRAAVASVEEADTAMSQLASSM